MPEYTFTVNGEDVTVDVDEKTPLLWILRDNLGLTGTKYGCGEGACGACRVIVNGKAKNACVYPARHLEGKTIRTIESLSTDGSHPVQEAWLREEVSQCGYCQPGMIMSVTALFEEFPNPSEKEILEAMLGHACRCGTYKRVRKVIDHLKQQTEVSE